MGCWRLLSHCVQHIFLSSRQAWPQSMTPNNKCKQLLNMCFARLLPVRMSKPAWPLQCPALLCGVSDQVLMSMSGQAYRGRAAGIWHIVHLRRATIAISSFICAACTACHHHLLPVRATAFPARVQHEASHPLLSRWSHLIMNQ